MRILQPKEYMLPNLSTYSVLSCAGIMMRDSSPSDHSWPSANRAIFYPFVVPYKTAFNKCFWYNGGGPSGNVDFGIYSANLTKIKTLGTTSKTGANALQTATFALTLDQGQYYFALAQDGTTGYFASQANLQAQRAWGIFQMDTAFVLPASVTPATLSGTPIIPIMGLVQGTTI